MQVEAVEKNKVKLTFEVDAQRFEMGMQHSYNKNKASVNIPGFRKGKVPRKILEMQFGKEMLYDDAINFVLGDAYEAALTESGLEVVSKPDIDVVSLSPEEGVVFTAEIYVKPEVTVSNYRGITYSKNDTSATDEEIDAEINVAKEKNARIISVADRPVANGDIVTIDYEGSVDGIPFEGGIADNAELTIGSGTFIPGFEEQLVGHGLGAEVDVNVTFPKEYHSAALSGKKALFRVLIHDIKMKEMPEVNDEFAQDVSEFDTLAEYRASVGAAIEQGKIREAEHKKEDEVLDVIISQAVIDVPEVMIETQTDQMVEDFAQRIKRQGLTMEAYLQYVGQTPESLREAYRKNAEKQVKGRLVLEEIAKKENIEATDEDLEDEFTRMAEVYKMDKEKLKSIIGKKDNAMLKKDICVQKALKLVMDSAVEMDVMTVNKKGGKK